MDGILTQPIKYLKSGLKFSGLTKVALDRGKVVAIVHFRGTTHRTTQNLRET